MNGRPLYSIDHYIMRLAARAIGTNVPYTIRKRGESGASQSVMNVKIAKLPEREQKSWRITGDNTPLSGCVVTELSYPFVGVIIVAVEEDSRAHVAGFHPGDRILELNDIIVRSVQDIQVPCELH